MNATPIARIIDGLRNLGARSVVLYGYKTPRHTHHWVMLAIHRAFERALADQPDLALQWFDNADEIPTESLHDAVVFGNMNLDRVDWNLPLTGRATYVMHQHNPSQVSAARYDALKAAGRCVFYEVFRGAPKAELAYESIAGEPDCHTRNMADANAVITWATDLLPAEIHRNIEALAARVPESPDAGAVVFVGSVWRANGDELADLAGEAVARGLGFTQYGRTMVEAPFPDDIRVALNPGSVSFDAHQSLVRDALIAPAIQGRHQLRNPMATGNYIGCGSFGTTAVLYKLSGLG